MSEHRDALLEELRKVMSETPLSDLGTREVLEFIDLHGRRPAPPQLIDELRESIESTSSDCITVGDARILLAVLAAARARTVPPTLRIVPN